MKIINLSLKKVKAIQILVSTYFKDSKGEPYHMTLGECLIFYAVIKKDWKWVWISAPTRYGKTETIALALLYLAVFKHIKIPVVGGSSEKAEKIMEYIISHIDDSPVLYDGLINIEVIDDLEKMKAQKLKIQMSKQALKWRDGGWIYITSVDSRNKMSEGSRVVGEGGDIVTLEEAGLIKNKEQYSKVVRMPEGEWGKLIMSGNCIEGSVFESAYHDPLFIKVKITLEQAIKEGRYTQKQLDEKKTQTTPKDWKRYYLVEFPKENEFTYFKPRRYDLLPKELEYYGAIDPALGESKDGSKIGIIILGKDKNGIKYEVESIVEHMKPDEAVDRIFNMPYKFVKFVFESIQFQKYFLKITNQRSLELGRGIRFEGIIQSRNKTERIESLEPDINNDRILFRGNNQLWEDMQTYPNTEYLDGLDALEMCNRASEKKKVTLSIGGKIY